MPIMLSNSLYSIISNILVVLSLLSAVLIVVAPNPVVSVLFLIVVFVSVSCYLIMMGMTFIGLSYIIVYVGAIAVLVLFVIIILNMKLSEMITIGSEYTKSIPITIFITMIVIFLFNDVLTIYINNTTFIEYYWGIITTLSIPDVYTNVFIVFNQQASDQIMYLLPNHQVIALGILLYNVYPISLIIVSIVLLLAIIVPIGLTKSRSLLYIIYTLYTLYYIPLYLVIILLYIPLYTI